MTQASDGRECFHQSAKLWRWVTATEGNWFFLRFTGEVAEAISTLALMRRLESERRRGWGSLKVEARIGATRWNTSIFPGDEGSWLLPVKRAVRESEGLSAGTEVLVEVVLYRSAWLNPPLCRTSHRHSNTALS